MKPYRIINIIVFVEKDSFCRMWSSKSPMLCSIRFDHSVYGCQRQIWKVHTLMNVQTLSSFPNSRCATCRSVGCCGELGLEFARNIRSAVYSNVRLWSLRWRFREGVLFGGGWVSAHGIAYFRSGVGFVRRGVGSYCWLMRVWWVWRIGGLEMSRNQVFFKSK